MAINILSKIVNNMNNYRFNIIIYDNYIKERHDAVKEYIQYYSNVQYCTTESNPFLNIQWMEEISGVFDLDTHVKKGLELFINIDNDKTVVLFLMSEYILSGIRLAIKRKMLKHTDCIIHFIYQNNDKDSLQSIHINEVGELDYWPITMFNYMKYISELIEWK